MFIPVPNRRVAALVLIAGLAGTALTTTALEANAGGGCSGSSVSTKTVSHEGKAVGSVSVRVTTSGSSKAYCAQFTATDARVIGADVTLTAKDGTTRSASSNLSGGKTGAGATFGAPRISTKTGTPTANAYAKLKSASGKIEGATKPAVKSPAKETPEKATKTCNIYTSVKGEVTDGVQWYKLTKKTVTASTPCTSKLTAPYYLMDAKGKLIKKDLGVRSHACYRYDLTPTEYNKDFWTATPQSYQNMTRCNAKPADADIYYTDTELIEQTH